MFCNNVVLCFGQTSSNLRRRPLRCFTNFQFFHGKKKLYYVVNVLLRRPNLLVRRHKEDALESLALGLNPRHDETVNIQRLLLGHREMNHTNNALLPHAHSPRNGLAHQRSRPPRGQEDATVKLLQIETDTPTVNLDEQNLARRKARCSQRLITLRNAHLAVVHLHTRDNLLILQVRLEQTHLLVKLAEDDVLVGRVCAQLVANHRTRLHELGRHRCPVLARVRRIALAHGGDVNLRMDGCLTQTEKHQHLVGGGHIVHIRVHARCLNLALNRAIDALLSVGGELQDLLLNHRPRQVIRRHDALQIAMNHNLGNKVLHAGGPCTPLVLHGDADELEL